jgi:trehalose synthase
MNERLVQIEDYEQFVGAKTVERVIRKTRMVGDMHVAHVNSTYYGGGVAEMLSSLTLLMNSAGIMTGWRVIQGSPDFFSVTKKMHNALQGGKIKLSERKMQIYEDVIFENAIRNHLGHDIVLIHDPQPLPMIRHYKKRGPWIWRCHLDLSQPDKKLWGYLHDFVNQYDAVIMSIKEYRQKIAIPQLFFMPAIDPFSIKNRPLTEKEIDERLHRYKVPTDLPLIVQISRFDRWKDPKGVIKAFQIARKKVDSTLVLLGDVATDDPEGEEIYQSLLDCREERIIILSRQDTALVNALQRRATVVLQKSIREGFGLTVTEAMWKGTPVIGGNVGGIKHQIKNGINGFLVSSIEEAADRIVQVLKNEKLRARLGKEARATVKHDFLMIRLLEQYLDLFNSFETIYKIKKTKGVPKRR